MRLTDEVRQQTIRELREHGHELLPTCYATTGKWCPEFYVDIPTGQVIGLRTPEENRKKERPLYGMRGVRFCVTEKAARLLIKRLVTQYDAQPIDFYPTEQEQADAKHYVLGMRLAQSLVHTYAEHAPYGLPLLGRTGGCRGVYVMGGNRPQMLLWAAGETNALYNQATYRAIKESGAPIEVWQFSRDQFGTREEVVAHA